jgi:hypothetical protein
VTKHNLGAGSTTVLLSGCSAGGLATYLHSDAIREWLLQTISATLTKFRAAPLSGFFLTHNSAVGVPVYREQLVRAFNTHNSSGGVDAGCRSATPAAQQWQCIVANYSFAHTTTPTFVLNSAWDWWQTKCIFAAGRVDPTYTPSPQLNSEGMNGNCTFAGMTPLHGARLIKIHARSVCTRMVLDPDACWRAACSLEVTDSCHSNET